MKNFKDYLEEGAKSYQYVIKFAMEPNDRQIEMIETFLKRYDLKKIEGPRLVDDDKSFINIPKKQVHEVVAEIGSPVSQYILLQDLRSVANISENEMVVRSMNEPIERYSQLRVWNKKIDSENSENDETNAPRLSVDRNYTKEEQPPVEDLFGNEYNKKLLTYLAGVADSRPSKQVDPQSPLFGWIQMKNVKGQEPEQDTTDFNTGIDSVKPVSVGNTKDPIDQEWMNSFGTMSDDSVPTVRFIKNTKTGKTHQVVKPSETI